MRVDWLKAQGYEGAENDMSLAFFKDNGAISSVRNDAEKQFLLSKGVAPGQLNDMWFRYLGSLGFSGALNDRMKSFTTSFSGPAFDFDFTTGELDPAITYTRTGPATQVYAGGMVDWSPENTIPSSDLSSGQWTLGIVPTLVLDVPPPVAGGLVYECEFNASNLVRRAGTGSLGSTAYAGLPMARSVWVRRGRTSSSVAVNVTTNNTAAWNTGGTARVVLTDEWQRVSIEDLMPGGSCYFMIGATQGNNFSDVTAYGKVLVCAPRYQRGRHSLSQDDALTTLSNVPNYNAPRFDYSTGTRHLLVEAQVTNYITHSRDFTNGSWAVSSGGGVITATNVSETVNEDGGTTQSLITATAATFPRVAQGSSVALGTGTNTVTSSVFIKYKSGDPVVRFFLRNAAAGAFASDIIFNLQTGVTVSSTGGVAAKALAGGWWMLSITGACTGGSSFWLSGGPYAGAAWTGAFYLDEAQHEIGGTPTSRIRTSGAAATRAADSVSVTGAPFTSKWNPVEGSAYIEGYCSGGSTHLFATFDNGTSTNLISFVAQRAGSSGGAGTQVFSGGVLQCDLLQTGLPASSAGKKLAVSWKAAEVYSVQGGQPLKTSLTAALPAITPDRLIIGDRGVGGVPLNGGIKRLIYWTTAKTPTELENLVL